jgi:hypothetical protein
VEAEVAHLSVELIGSEHQRVVARRALGFVGGDGVLPAVARLRSYVAPMGSSGMKRKGRQHLPKAGTRPDRERVAHDREAQALHPFSSDPFRKGGGRAAVTAAVVAVIVVIGIIALVLLT